MSENKNNKTLTLGSRRVGIDEPPYIVAEMSGNHNQSLERALSIVDAAASAGVDALKIQTYTADTMTIDCDSPDFRIADPKSLWNGENLYQLYQKARTPWDWHHAIFKRCHERGIVGFSTPFDETSLEFLEKCGVPFYKIASFENTDLPLIRAVAGTGKPVIISTGMMTYAELDATVSCARNAGCSDLILLKCTSTYPAKESDSNLLTIPALRQRYDCEIGVSDHTLGIGAAIAAVAHGASFIEKHFTLCRDDGGVDSTFSLEPEEMKNLVTESRRARDALGKNDFGRVENEKNSLQFRRSVYAVKDISPGEAFTSENIRRIRPGFGLAPQHYDAILGRKASVSIQRGTPLSWKLIEGGGP